MWEGISPNPVFSKPITIPVTNSDVIKGGNWAVFRQMILIKEAGFRPLSDIFIPGEHIYIQQMDNGRSYDALFVIDFGGRIIRPVFTKYVCH